MCHYVSVLETNVYFDVVEDIAKEHNQIDHIRSIISSVSGSINSKMEQTEG